MATKHHVVPRFYLAGFADPADNIVSVNRKTGQEHKSRVRKAARRAGFYALEDAEGQWHEDAEELMSQLEGDAAAALKLVRAGIGRSLEEKAALATFIALQFVRGQDRRDATNLAYDHMSKLMLAGLPEDDLSARILEVDESASEEEIAVPFGAWRFKSSRRHPI